MKILLTALFIIFTLLLSPTETKAQYFIEFSAEIEGTQFPTSDFTATVPSTFSFLPSIEVFEDGDISDASVTLESPAGSFRAFFNGGFNSSSRISDTQGVTNEANGVWSVTIEDNGNIFEYEADVELSLPFAQIPFFTSTLANGDTVGTFEWVLNGGSEIFPGMLSGISVDVLADGTFERVDSALLPPDATSWTPQGDFTVADEYRGTIRTSNEARDFTALSVAEIRPLTVGAPELTILPAFVQYGALLQVILLPQPVPEPTSAGLALMAFTTLLVRRNRNSYAQ